jgi:hypothetical protein
LEALLLDFIQDSLLTDRTKKAEGKEEKLQKRKKRKKSLLNREPCRIGRPVFFFFLQPLSMSDTNASAACNETPHALAH